MICTVIYVDVLIFVNAITDYCLILATSYLLKRKIKEVRLIISSVAASLTSLYIFANIHSKVLDVLIRLAIALFITLTAFGYKSPKKLCKAFIAFIAVTLIYNGLMTLCWTVFKIDIMVINNSIVYFDISAISLIIFSVVAFFIIKLGQRIIRIYTPYAKRVNVRFCNKGSVLDTVALVDSGNSLNDIYANRSVFITDKKTAREILGETKDLMPLLLPFETVSGKGFFNAYPCEKAYIETKEFNHVLIAVSKSNFDSDYRVIINPEILEV